MNQSHEIKAPVYEPVAEILNTMPATAVRWLVYILACLVMTGFIWAYFSRIDIVISAPTLFVHDDPFDTHFHLIQSRFAGIVTQIYKKEGDAVKKGEIVAELESENVHDILSEINHLKQKRISLEALLAKEVTLKEQRHSEIKTKHRHQKKLQQEELVKQRHLLAELTSEQNHLRDQLQHKIPEKFDVEMKIAKDAHNNALHKYEQVSEAIQKGWRTGEDLPELKNSKEATGLALERIEKERKQEIANTQAGLNKLEEQIRRAHSDESLLALQYPKDQTDIALRLTTTESQRQAQQTQIEMASLDAKVEQLQKSLHLGTASFQIKDNPNKPGTWRVELQSDSDGYITTKKITAPGEMITAGQTLFHIVPQNSPLVAEIAVQNKDIGLIQPGMPVKFKLDAFPYQDYGMLEGLVWKISPDAQEDPKAGSVYKLIARFDEPGLREINRIIEPTRLMDSGDFETMIQHNRERQGQRKKHIVLKSGMLAKAEIVTEKKSLLALFIKPFHDLKESASSLR